MFRFKQFTIHQDQCAMKVCIDSCIFGAWVNVSENDKILDIGTGTGLLSLMLAQKNKSLKIDAVEIDEDAYGQATENFNQSKQISLYHQDIKTFNKDNYDRIIVNPPFYMDGLSSPNAKKNKAKHQETLTLKELAEQISLKLNFAGTVAIMLPPVEMLHMEKFMSLLDFRINKRLQVKHQKGMKVFREMAEFSKKEVPYSLEELYIKEEDNQTYSDDFQALLKEYYIIF
ncbi:tRNA1(Val) (adenine(37)-N6)-methyltransferase [Arcticibacterium luteifluviistationis]|uniref:tRNA1(Val) (adenine(37)-N6)-methyltransferase n=1 Tax=Arcticibacterium luteifluviistationis TaxID=1784714 RepID=A0A2Z4GFT2_9BACT|nr:methyltransferase [Arcticibacterium luteifluviistationis]AWW00250.1 methyltransferase [Arcticibacterium luteifluviistationis]